MKNITVHNLKARSIKLVEERPTGAVNEEAEWNKPGKLVCV